MGVAHVVGFAVLTTFLLHHSLKIASERAWHWLPVLSICVLFVSGLAVVSEGLQMFTARDADIADLVRDASGIAAGVAFSAAVSSRGIRRLLILACACTILVIGAWAPGSVLLAMGIAQLRVPLLIDFEGMVDGMLCA
jgi:hypothetical protein